MKSTIEILESNCLWENKKNFDCGGITVIEQFRDRSNIMYSFYWVTQPDIVEGEEEHITAIWRITKTAVPVHVRMGMRKWFEIRGIPYNFKDNG